MVFEKVETHRDKLDTTWPPTFWRKFLKVFLEKNFDDLRSAGDHLDSLVASYHPQAQGQEPESTPDSDSGRDMVVAPVLSPEEDMELTPTLESVTNLEINPLAPNFLAPPMPPNSGEIITPLSDFEQKVFESRRQ